MNRENFLETMIHNKRLEDNDEENLERYCEAFEMLSDTMYESLDISTEEMRLMIQSFSNKENHTYFLDMLEDAILLHLDNTNEYEVFFEEVQKNKEGFVEALSVMYGIWVYHKEWTSSIKECVLGIDRELLEYALNDYGYQYDSEFKKIF